MILMLELFAERDNKLYHITEGFVAELGDRIVLIKEKTTPPFVSSIKSPEFHIIVISPIGTIIDSKRLNLSSTGPGCIYSFPILPILYSGAYIFHILGDIERRWKVYIRTPKQLRYNWQLSYLVMLKNPNTRPLNNFIIDIAIPPHLSPFQQVHLLFANKPPKEVRIDKEGNRWLRFTIRQISPHEEIKIAYRCIITTTVIAYDINQIKQEQILEEELQHEYSEIFRAYTAPEPFIESNHPKIRAVAERYRNFPPISRIYAFIKFIRNNIEFSELNGEYGAAFAIEKKIGDCTELATLFVSLCRAVNIPARLVTAMVPTSEGRWEQHAQAEFFMNGIWIPIDPTLIEHTEYLIWNPECIILQKGNFLSKTNVKEVRYRYDRMEVLPLNIYLYKTVKKITRASVTGTPIEIEKKEEIPLFRKIKWKFQVELDDIIKNEYSSIIDIKPILPEAAPARKPFKIPLHIYNKTDNEIKGTLKILFQRGGGNTVHIIYLKIPKRSHRLISVSIPATNYLGDTIIEFIFQNEKGIILGYKAKKINFQ